MAKNNSDKDKNKQDENLEIFKDFLDKKKKTPTHPIDQLAKEGADLLEKENPSIQTNPVIESKPIKPSNNPYDRAKVYVMSKMDKWTKERFEVLCNKVKNNILIENAADQRLFDSKMAIIKSIGGDLADGLPLPK
jgi:hypothetical protein